MNRYSVIFIYLFFIPFFAHAQLGKNNIKVNAMQIGLGEASITYERVIEDIVSLQLRPGYFFDNTVQINNDDYDKTGFGLDLEAKFFFAHNASAPQGFYFSPYVMSSWFKEEIEADPDNNIDADTDQLHLLQYGLAVGYQKIIGDHFVIDGNIGNNRNDMYEKDLERNDFYDADYDDSYLPRVSVAFGYHF